MGYPLLVYLLSVLLVYLLSVLRSIYCMCHCFICCLHYWCICCLYNWCICCIYSFCISCTFDIVAFFAIDTRAVFHNMPSLIILLMHILSSVNDVSADFAFDVSIYADIFLLLYLLSM